jgi:hypothetical protein
VLQIADNDIRTVRIYAPATDEVTATG